MRVLTLQECDVQVSEASVGRSEPRAFDWYIFYSEPTAYAAQELREQPATPGGCQKFGQHDDLLSPRNLDLRLPNYSSLPPRVDDVQRANSADGKSVAVDGPVQ